MTIVDCNTRDAPSKPLFPAPLTSASHLLQTMVSWTASVGMGIFHLPQVMTGMPSPGSLVLILGFQATDA
jgi:hypothetical protein